MGSSGIQWVLPNITQVKNNTSLWCSLPFFCHFVMISIYILAFWPRRLDWFNRSHDFDLWLHFNRIQSVDPLLQAKDKWMDGWMDGWSHGNRCYGFLSPQSVRGNTRPPQPLPLNCMSKPISRKRWLAHIKNGLWAFLGLLCAPPMWEVYTCLQR